MQPRQPPGDPRPAPVELVELVDAGGRPLGSMAKLGAHTPPGELHRAVSVFLTDRDGRLLLQRRAAGKYHSAGLWSNTCCTHPAPGEPPAAAATRRLRQELGLDPAGLTEVGTLAYAVVDPVSGLVEREWNHLFVGLAVQDPEPDPREVGSCAAVPLGDLDRMQRRVAFTAWFPLVLKAVRPVLAAPPATPAT